MQRVGKVEIYALQGLQGGKSREVQPRFAKAHLVILVMLRGREAATRLRGRNEAGGYEPARPRRGLDKAGGYDAARLR